MKILSLKSNFLVLKNVKISLFGVLVVDEKTVAAILICLRRRRRHSLDYF